MKPYEERLADAKAFCAQPVGDDLPTQKFKRGARVKVVDELPSTKSHFPSGFEAIVGYTYGQKFGGDNVASYSLVMLDERDKSADSIAWYLEEELILVDADVTKGLEIIKDKENG